MDPDPYVSFRLVEPDELRNGEEPEQEEYDNRPIEKWDYWYITAYNVTREYGGPEEGGWYYDAYSVVETRESDSYEGAEQIRDLMRREYETHEVEPGLGGREILGKEKPRSERTLRPGAEDVPDNYEPMSQEEDESYMYDPGSIRIVIESSPGSLETRERPHYE